MEDFEIGALAHEYDWDHDDKIRAEGADRENDLTQESRESRGGN